MAVQARRLQVLQQRAVVPLGDGERDIGWAQLADDLAGDLRLHQAHSMARRVEVCRGNLPEAARRLGIGRNALDGQLEA